MIKDQSTNNQMSSFYLQCLVLSSLVQMLERMRRKMLGAGMVVKIVPGVDLKAVHAQVRGEETRPGRTELGLYMMTGKHVSC